MRGIEELHDLALGQLLLESAVLLLHPAVLVPSVRETHIGIVPVGFQVAAELVMRGQLRRVLGELLKALEGGLAIGEVFLVGVFFLLAV